MRPLGQKLAGRAVTRAADGRAAGSTRSAAWRSAPCRSSARCSPPPRITTRRTPLLGFFVRKEAKKHGLGQQIEGALRSGQTRRAGRGHDAPRAARRSRRSTSSRPPAARSRACSAWWTAAKAPPRPSPRAASRSRRSSRGRSAGPVVGADEVNGSAAPLSPGASACPISRTVEIGCTAGRACARSAAATSRVHRRCMTRGAACSSRRLRVAAVPAEGRAARQGGSQPLDAAPTARCCYVARELRRGDAARWGVCAVARLAVPRAPRTFAALPCRPLPGRLRRSAG